MSTDFPADLLDAIEEPMVEIRHDLHMYPELAFEEFRTTRVITERLIELGFEIRPCPTSTGVVARLRGATPGRRVMIRADIDALPVTEERPDLSFVSRTDGAMHACGHDVHVAGLLGVADLLSRCRSDVAGEYVLLFQPAEEAVSGASAMIEGGVLESNPVDYVIGAHVTSLAPVGFVASRAGIMMSYAQALSIHIRGKGGHGAMSTSEGNVVLAISEIAPRLGEIVEGLVYEGTQCACSAGVIRAGTANNVVPRHAVLQGTLRTFTPDQRTEALARLNTLIDDVSSRFAVTCEIEISQGTPAVANDPTVTQSVLASATRVVGEAGVLAIPPFTPSDDVSEFLERVPGCYMFVGGALADGTSGMHHAPDFAIDDGACRIVAAVLATAASDLAAAAN
ncbi:MAG TPA: M20 family metallopeptidase [Acidimicrobiales bacterium]|jgi:amidohydrolase